MAAISKTSSSSPATTAITSCAGSFPWMGSTDRHRGWAWFLAWSVPGACVAVGVSQVGLLTIPLGALLGIWLSRRGAGWEALGLLAGVGLVGALIGLINLGANPCPSDETVVLGPGETDASCGGFDGRPWLVAGLVFIATGVLAYRRLTRHAAP